jgi:hypothetical protein
MGWLGWSALASWLERGMVFTHCLSLPKRFPGRTSVTSFDYVRRSFF